VSTPVRAQFVVQPTLEDVAQAVQALQRALPARLPEPDRHALEIALCEVLTNIVQHGLAGAAGAPIEVSCEERADAVVVEVRDSGRAIPRERLDAAGPDAFDFDSDDLAALPQGGFGLALVKAAFDVVDYRSEDGVNCMHLEKRLA
jgi:serine/threonine-protein kinase RsbW